MKKRWRISLLAGLLVLAFLGTGIGQVLGPCGGSQQKPAKGAKMEMKMHQTMQMVKPGHHLLLPGDQAINFSLPAVVGSTIKTVKLSDFAGKWRIVCFYPGDFTFV